MRVIGLKNELNLYEIKTVLKKHYPKLDNDSLNGLSKAIASGNCLLEDDWALEADLKDLGVRIS